MDIIERLEATREETLRHFQLGELELAHSYAEGKWSIRFILHHLADAETVLFDRVRRVLSEGRRVLWVFDQDAWAKAWTIPSFHSTSLGKSTSRFAPGSSSMRGFTTTRAVISSLFTATPEYAL